MFKHFLASFVLATMPLQLFSLNWHNQVSDRLFVNHRTDMAIASASYATPCKEPPPNCKISQSVK